MFKYIKITIIVFVCIVFFVVLLTIYKLNNTTIRQTKDYTTIYVEVEDVIDADAMISPPEKYSQLLQIDIEIRSNIAAYMKKNNLKLKNGKQKFIRNTPTLEELVNDGFVFEKIE